MILRVLVSIGLSGFFLQAALAHEGHEHFGDRGNQVTITIAGDQRVITSNGLPEHATGQFPGAHNPNAIKPQQYEFRVPAKPQLAKVVTPLYHQPFGVAINGVVFDPGTAEWWQRAPALGWNYEAMSGKIDLGLDHSHAHVQPSGAYHYHGLPTGLIDDLGGLKDRMLLVGYAADGFPMYAVQAYADPNDPASGVKRMRSSYRLKSGERPAPPTGPGGAFDGTFTVDYEYVAGSGDLDMCNGRTGVTPDYPEGTYYYVLTEEFPHVPRLYRGTPDPSFARALGVGLPPGLTAPKGPPRGFYPPRH